MEQERVEEPAAMDRQPAFNGYSSPPRRLLLFSQLIACTPKKLVLVVSDLPTLKFKRFQEDFVPVFDFPRLGRTFRGRSRARYANGVSPFA